MKKPAAARRSRVPFSVTVFFSADGFSEKRLLALDEIATAHGARRLAEPAVHCGEVGIEYRLPGAAAPGLAGAFHKLKGSEVLVAREDQ